MDKLFQFVIWTGFFSYWLTVAIVTLRLVLKRRAMGVTIAWLMIIYIIPVLGIGLYLLFGELNLGRKRAERAKSMFPPYKDWFSKIHTSSEKKRKLSRQLAVPVHNLCKNRMGIPALNGNQLTLHTQTLSILQSIAKEISQAKQNIHMTFYIWQPGGQADAIAEKVCQAAKRGVSVRILLDSAGSKAFFKSEWPHKMRQAGVELIEALAVSPARMFFRRLDIRQHRKIVVIDNLLAYTGSMNLVDPRFFKQEAGIGQWVDIMIAIRGPAVPIINSIFSWDWEVETGLRFLPQLPVQPNASTLKHTHHRIQVAPSGPSMPDGIIQQILILAIHQAQKNLTITTPYLIPSESLISALQTTAERGVTVNIIIPEQNDSLMVEWASRSFFSDLLNSGINIYRFNGGLLHTKSVMVDECFCLLGTVNLDMRSLWLNFELTLCIDDPDFCHELILTQKNYLEQSHKIDLDKWNKRPLYVRPIEQFFYLFSPLL